MATNYKFLFCLSVIYLTALYLCSGQEIAVPVPPERCAVQAGTGLTQYFDVLQMICKPCTALFSIADSSSAYNCVCKPGYRTKSNFGGNQVKCEPCGAGEVRSADGLTCITCGFRTPVQGTGAALQCPNCSPSNGTIEVEKGLNGGYLANAAGALVARCETCAAETLPNLEQTSCERCSNILDTSNATKCVCDTLTSRMAGGYCFRVDKLPSRQDLNPRVLLSSDGDSRSSDYLVFNLEASYGLCKDPFHDITAAVRLANLCVLTFYKRLFRYEYAYAANELGPCDLLEDCLLSYDGKTLADTNSPNYAIWPDTIPWLYYAPGSQPLDSRTISTKFSLVKDSIDNRIRMFVAVYTINGTYLGLKSVKNGVIQLCPNTQEKLNAAWSFGTAYEQSCDLNVFELMTRETLFYDPYIEYTTSSETLLYPVPVLIANYYDSNSEQVNSNGDRDLWQLTRRFFLVENALFPGTPRPQVVRYVSDMRLYIKLVSGGEGEIFTPYLKITYSHALDGDSNANTTVTSSFGISYELNSERFDNDIMIALATLSVLAGLYSCIQTWSWARRTGNPSFPLVIIKFFAYSTGTLSNAFLITLVSISLWWLVFFKRQDVVYLLPVTADQERFFGNFIIVAFVLKILDIIHLFAMQVKIDIFLIDWERPKSTPKEKQSGNESGDTPGESSVSIWRTYFVANEWNEIQTLRKICPLFQLVVTLLFLKVIGFENICSKDRLSNFIINDNDYIAPHSKMFRFGVMSGIWFVVAVLQWIFFTLIWERFVEDKVRQFVDLCSMANISVFIMEFGQFGYYIHGRSPHGIADTGMKEMFRQLKRETENLCAHRGLVPNTDAQTFRMALPETIRFRYDEIFRTLNQRRTYIKQKHLAVAFDEYATYNPDVVRENPILWHRPPTQAPTSRGQGGEVTDKQFQDLAANTKINKYMSDFLDHSLRDLDYIVKDKIFFESLLDVEFEQIIEKGIFYNDNGHAFDRVLFYGHEVSLTTFEVLLFGLVDLTSNQGFVLSAIIVYFVSLFFKLLRDGLGRKNLAEKTLVDERFLI